MNEIAKLTSVSEAEPLSDSEIEFKEDGTITLLLRQSRNYREIEDFDSRSPDETKSIISLLAV